jgi:hypothetical protein
MRLTSNYNLKKPEDHEAFDQQAHANANMDVIDAGLKANADAIAAHQAEIAPHGATPAVSADRLVLRDAAGRAKVAAPSVSDDIARKAEVDAHATAIAHRYARQFLLMGG